jgi:Xaa-Pro aminopeptidase
MCTKDAAEIERVRNMGKVTTGVVGRVQDWLSSSPVENDVLMDQDDKPLTIGKVKAKIDLWLAEAGAENPEGTIFSIGHDAGEPHSVGNPADLMRLGQTIVFDIYPCEARGGYFYDFTRTWCLGYAPDEARKLYDEVHSVYDQVYRELEVGKPCEYYQHRTCELFEKLGHPTIDSDPVTEVGYVHSLGHGVGLQVHEAPWFSATSSTHDTLTPGQIFTLEPGLYYPDRGLGVRIEDTLCVTPDGKFEIMVDYPKELVLPVKKVRK